MTNQSIIETIEHDPDITENHAVLLDSIAAQSEQCLMLGIVLDGFYNLIGGRQWPCWGRC